MIAMLWNGQVLVLRHLRHTRYIQSLVERPYWKETEDCHIHVSMGRKYQV